MLGWVLPVALGALLVAVGVVEHTISWIGWVGVVLVILGLLLGIIRPGGVDRVDQRAEPESPYF